MTATNHTIVQQKKIGGCVKIDIKLTRHNKGKHGEN